MEHKEPSKEAIAKACELLNLPIGHNGQWQHSSAVEPFARFIDHVSDVVGSALPWCQPGMCISVAQREKLEAIILPDPEPDVLEELRSKFDAFARDLAPAYSGAGSRTECRQGAMDRLNKQIIDTLRGYAITKTEDTSHG